jgi:tRNA-splicing ligase RtcB
MIVKENLKRLGPFCFELPADFKPGMNCAARIYIDQDSLDSVLSEKSLEQLVNVASLPGAAYVAAMPDLHQGYGFPIGGVAAILADSGVISPGGVGYDINCGVRVLYSSLTKNELQDKLDTLATQIQRDVPGGMGRGGSDILNELEMTEVLNRGVEWAIESGFGVAEDAEYIEERGSYHHADAACVSAEARKRGHDQLGTIGSGNHFVELQCVDRIFDQEIAQIFGLFEEQIIIMIHTGSRGLGHQVCTDYVKTLRDNQSKYGLTISDRELSSAPFQSEDGQRYFKAMAAAANFAWANRQVITFHIRNAFKRVLGEDCCDLKILYDVGHNIAKLEYHQGQNYIVHRKGATRAFGPGSNEIPQRYKSCGQPVLIPGSMGTFSYILAGTSQAMNETFGSSCHGAGRRMSRTKAKKSIDYNKLRKKLEDYGVVVRAGSAKGLLEEAPEAYKDINLVIETVARNGIARPVARARPIAVIKG